MSNEAINWAYKQTLKSGPKFVLVALADHADERHSCFPSYARLERMTGYKERALAKHIAKLESLGLLSREAVNRADGKRLGTRYFLAVTETQITASQPPAQYAGGDQATCTNVQEPPAQNDKATCTDVQGYRGNPQENPQGEPSTARASGCAEVGSCPDKPDKPEPDDAEDDAVSVWREVFPEICAALGSTKVELVGDGPRFAGAVLRSPGWTPRQVADAILAQCRAAAKIEPDEKFRKPFWKLLSAGTWQVRLGEVAHDRPGTYVDEIAKQEAGIAQFLKANAA